MDITRELPYEESGMGNGYIGLGKYVWLTQGRAEGEERPHIDCGASPRSAKIAPVDITHELHHDESGMGNGYMALGKYVWLTQGRAEGEERPRIDCGANPRSAKIAPVDITNELNHDGSGMDKGQRTWANKCSCPKAAPRAKNGLI